MTTTVEMSPSERMLDVIVGIDTGMTVIEIWTEIEQEIGIGVMMTVMEEVTVADVIPLLLTVSHATRLAYQSLLTNKTSHENEGLDGETNPPKSKSPVCPSRSVATFPSPSLITTPSTSD